MDKPIICAIIINGNAVMVCTGLNKGYCDYGVPIKANDNETAIIPAQGDPACVIAEKAESETENGR